ncbi:outer membrane protein assembly factor BamE [Magnetofaba australis]|uniref:Outer membrane protein assembly factor BamE domain-containing protein n=1 Tax=Magnetofaba australis IT-1 TaxID=1434232 RepID=A0A1Y2K695_9PROT|nr:outer membrane protein assembly factor BamE [Magnetofaba australis]OSM05073.1 hypothetical protein MAIT1_03211 [Magnetofaba australis IT-1]
MPKPVRALFWGLIIPMLTFGCQSMPENHGNILDVELVNRIVPGQTHAREVIEMLGAPTIVNPVRPDRWIYVMDRRAGGYETVNTVEITLRRGGVIDEVKRNFDDKLRDPEQMVAEKGKRSWWRRTWGKETWELIPAPEGGKDEVAALLPEEKSLLDRTGDTLTDALKLKFPSLTKGWGEDKQSPAQPADDVAPPTDPNWWRSVLARDPAKGETMTEPRDYRYEEALKEKKAIENADVNLPAWMKK